MHELIEIPVGDATAEAYVARPDTTSDKALPGVLLFIDAIGLRPVIAQMADRMASWGYVVLAPNIFYRLGTAQETSPDRPLTEPGAREEFFKEMMPRVGGYTPNLSGPDTDAWLTALAHQPGVAAGKVGVTWYCMGARLATRAAGDHPDVVAAVGGFHGGGLVTDEPDSPHHSLSRARADFVYLHADADPSMPAAAIAALGDSLAAHGLRASNEVALGAPHGYTMADTSMYHEEGAEQHFRELEGLFARTLGVSSNDD
ncbi:MAG: dienelactone hydrolase family protein [Cumulibacter sp.]